MKKASDKDSYGYDSTFPTLLRELLESSNVTQEALAKHCGVQRQSIAQWKDGNTKPDIMSLKKIAEFFDVSTDYLLGLTPNATTDTELNAVCEYTGLSENAVNSLVELKELKYSKSRAYIDLLSCIISDANLKYFMGVLEGYITPERELFDAHFAMSRAQIDAKDLSIYVASNELRNIMERIAPVFLSNYLTTDQLLEIRMRELFAEKGIEYPEKED